MIIKELKHILENLDSPFKHIYCFTNHLECCELLNMPMDKSVREVYVEYYSLCDGNEDRYCKDHHLYQNRNIRIHVTDKIDNFLITIINSRYTELHYIKCPTLITDIDKISYLNEVVNQTPTLFKYKKNGELNDFLLSSRDFISENKKNLNLYIKDNYSNDFEIIFKEYEDFIHSKNLIDREDLALYVYEILLRRPFILRIYKRFLYLLNPNIALTKVEKEIFNLLMN